MPLLVTFIAVPALLLTGCSKLSQEAAFQKYVDNNKLFMMMNGEFREKILAGMKSRRNDLKTMVAEAAEMLQLMLVHSTPAVVFDITAFRMEVQSNPSFLDTRKQWPQSEKQEMETVLLAIVEDYVSRLTDSPELQVTQAVFESMAKKAFHYALGEYTSEAFRMYMLSLVDLRYQDQELTQRFNDFIIDAKRALMEVDEGGGDVSTS